MPEPRATMDGAAPSAKFGLALLGNFELTGPDGVIDLSGGKLAGLLAYLACTAPRPQPRERLSTLLWGSHFDAQAKQNLRQALSRLRRALGPDAFGSDGEVVWLNAAAVRCDVTRFEALIREGSREALSAATALYRGRLVDDIAVSEEGWTDWLTAERERLLDMALGALMALGEQELAAGRAEQALQAGRRAVALNNLREDAHRLIVRALAATGRKAEALRHYQDLVVLLKRELNAEPDAATRALVAELRTAQPPGGPPPQPPDRASTAGESSDLSGRLVGRREQIDVLLRRWDQARRGEGGVALLSGESGLGKSRIAEEVLARLGNEPRTHLRYFCSPHHRHTPLHPFAARLERAAGIEPGSDARARFDRLAAWLGPTTKNVSRDVAFIAELLGLPNDSRYKAPAVSPEQKRELTLVALLDQLADAATRRPLLIVFEDLHWIDPTSQDLLDRLVARIANLPVLLLVTSRPEVRPTWAGEPHVTMLPLSRLGRLDSARIVAGVTGGKALPDVVVEQILANGDGVPLFIEELTNMLLESGLVREAEDRYLLDGPLPPLALPTTLQDALVARLERLGAARDVAQIGAAIGRHFSYELISALSAVTAGELDAALEALTASGLVIRRGTPPEATYSFKHALVQDAAYGTMLRSRRRRVHATVARALVERFAALADRMPEAVARHYTEAGQAGEAIGWWLKSGQLALARSANREAATSFEWAMLLLGAQPETRERLELAIEIRLGLWSALQPLGDRERVAEHVREAEELARKLGNQQQLAEIARLQANRS